MRLISVTLVQCSVCLALNTMNVLQGETVDGRVCETLEEIFRRVRFRCIDLEATSLDEEV